MGASNRDPARVARLLASLARNVATHAVAFEVKLGQGQVNAAAASLIRFAARIDTASCGEPALLGVIVATGYGYRRDDGVAVIPIGALGP